MFKYIYFCQNTQFHLMNKERIPQQLYNFLEDAYRTFYHTVFLEVSKSHGITSNGLKIKNAACIRNVSKNFFTSWNLGLTEEEVRLIIRDKINSQFKYNTVQEDWPFRTRNHLEKFEKAERRRKLKKFRKLSNNKTLYFKCLERLKALFEFFSFKFKFLELGTVLPLILKTCITSYI